MRRLSLIISLLCCFQLVHSQERYSIVIDEIMADPNPPVGMPAYEWIELKNTGLLPVNLQNWRIGDATGQSGPFPDISLAPDSFLILCSASALNQLSFFGHAVALSSFPSLDNDGDQLFVKAADGRIIHAVHYSSSWYKNELKKEGGWTLEMIDTYYPCNGIDNWKASIDTRGGTPGTINSVNANNPDTKAPQLINGYSTDSVNIVLVFDEPVDSLPASFPANYLIEEGIGIESVTCLPPLFTRIVLHLRTPMQARGIYHITAMNITDCSGNTIHSSNKIRTGLPALALPGDLIINEILFDPLPNGFDYVELYNKGEQIIDAAQLFIANRNSSAVISSVKVLSDSPHYLFPGDYCVVTENADNLALHYLVRNPEQVLEISSLPSFPNTEGDVIVLNGQGELLDELAYHQNWHFQLLSNTEGVALERINPSDSTQDKRNWHSAASTAGYGTPTYQNSQFLAQPEPTGSMEVTPSVFSPDNDGYNDWTSIRYKTDQPGYVANIVIFNAAGQPVRNLVRNETMGLSGYWNWNGLDENGHALSSGIYVVYAEIFTLQGKKKRYKLPVVLARRL